jgi:two-component system OmpR family response regulator
MFPEKPSILLVDDEPTVHLAVGSILRQGGYFVEGANDGVAGLRMFKERPWDLVMIDRAMPGMGGEELAEEIRKISSDVPLMLITGFLKSKTRVHLFNGILEKPFRKPELLAATRRLIDKIPAVGLQH